MQQFISNLPHLLMAAFIIAAGCTLAGMHVISGSDAVAVIAAAGGFSLGGGVASASSTAVAPVAVVTGTLTGQTTEAHMVTPSQPTQAA